MSAWGAQKRSIDDLVAGVESGRLACVVVLAGRVFDDAAAVAIVDRCTEKPIGGGGIQRIRLGGNPLCGARTARRSASNMQKRTAALPDAWITKGRKP